MIAPAIVERIKLLLAEGRLSQRKIAQATGVSRATIGAIASGRRPDYPRPRDDDFGFCQPNSPMGRCRGCGGIVSLPCLLCHVRSLKARREERRRRLRNLIERGRW